MCCNVACRSFQFFFNEYFFVSAFEGEITHWHTDIHWHTLACFLRVSFIWGVCWVIPPSLFFSLCVDKGHVLIKPPNHMKDLRKKNTAQLNKIQRATTWEKKIKSNRIKKNPEKSITDFRRLNRWVSAVIEKKTKKNMNCVNLLIFHRSSYRFEKMWTAVRCWARALCGASARRGRRRCSDWAILRRETPEKPGAEAQPVDGGWGQTKQPFPYAGSASPASPLRWLAAEAAFCSQCHLVIDRWTTGSGRLLTDAVMTSFLSLYFFLFGIEMDRSTGRCVEFD